jgi:predicted TIM-barrel fold metal-dependent hydrolase
MTDVIDACAFHDWRSNVDLVPFLTEGWGELVTLENLKVKGAWQNVHPLGGTLPDADPPRGGPPASDPDFLIKQLLDDRACDRVVLGHYEGLLSTGLPLPYEARAVVRAVNDWTRGEWLDRDDRLYAHLLVASTMPNEAAAEIRRVGEHDRFVAVALGANALNKPFGHPAYHPIFEAAAELDLPIVIQVGADNIADLGTSPSSVGLNTTYSEFYAMSAAPLMPHITSLITGGVFDLYPKLRVLVVGGGLAWLPQYIWRLDWNFKTVRRVEIPWSTRMPSDYIREHVCFTTYSIEQPPKPEQLRTMLEVVPGLESSLLYASGYPYIDGADPEKIAEVIPETWHDAVFRGNAEALYRWPNNRASVAPRTAALEQVTSAGDVA